MSNFAKERREESEAVAAAGRGDRRLSLTLGSRADGTPQALLLRRGSLPLPAAEGPARSPGGDRGRRPRGTRRPTPACLDRLQGRRPALLLEDSCELRGRFRRLWQRRLLGDRGQERRPRPPRGPSPPCGVRRGVSGGRARPPLPWNGAPPDREGVVPFRRGIPSRPPAGPAASRRRRATRKEGRHPKGLTAPFMDKLNKALEFAERGMGKGSRAPR
jgi:hypothetical protein